MNFEDKMFKKSFSTLNNTIDDYIGDLILVVKGFGHLNRKDKRKYIFVPEYERIYLSVIDGKLGLDFNGNMLINDSQYVDNDVINDKNWNYHRGSIVVHKSSLIGIKSINYEGYSGLESFHIYGEKLNTKTLTDLIIVAGEINIKPYFENPQSNIYGTLVKSKRKNFTIDNTKTSYNRGTYNVALKALSNSK